jgi:hypothetical protein
MDNKQWIEPDMQGSGHGLNTRYSGLSLKKDYENLQPE